MPTDGREAPRGGRRHYIRSVGSRPIHRDLCEACGMRRAMIAVVIAGCGGHSSSDSDAQMARPLAAEEIARACINAYACLAPPIDRATLPDCLHKLDDGDTV